MNVEHRASALLMLAVLCTALLACALTDKKRKAAVRAAPATLDALDRTLAALPSGTLGTKRCDDAALERARDPQVTGTTIDGFDAAALGRALKGVAPSSSDPWRWMNSSVTKYVTDTRRTGRVEGSTARHIHVLLQRGHVALFREQSRTAPSVAGAEFKPGSYVGTVIVMNLRTASVACHAPFAAENTPDFSSEQGAAGAELVKSAIKDLERNFDGALLEALRSISSSLVVKY